MYAVISTGGKQYRVKAGDLIQVEKLDGEEGSKVAFDQVLFLSQPGEKEGESSKVWVGKPTVDKAKVEGQIFKQGRGDKILIFKFKRRKKYRRTQGHRQEYTQILVTSVDNGAGQKDALSAADTKKKIEKSFSNLKPKGPARTPKTLGSRKKLKEAAEQKSA